jgi:HlyD family secretion protein
MALSSGQGQRNNETGAMTMLLIENQAQGKPAASRDMNWYVRLGMIGSICFLGGGLAWGTIAPLEGAVIAPGVIVVENNISKVQHLVGGVVGDILVKEGQRVSAGDVLVRLDETATRANLQIVRNEVVTARARIARLAAERDGRQEIQMPADLVERATRDADVRQALASETTLFEARNRTRRGQRSQYLEQISQLNQEIIGNEAQYASAKEQVSVASVELVDMRALLAKNLVARPRVTTLEREVARLRGTLGELSAKKAQIKARISETELQILQIDRTLEAEVGREIRENETRLNELAERMVTAEDQMRRIDLRAPRDGVVHQLQVHTVGGVIAPGAVLMSIVPERETLVIEARVNPIDIDQLTADQPTRIRFSAFNNRTTPELDGRVYRIAADLSRDERTGMPYYTVAIRVTDEEMGKLGNLKLIPGMPTESFIKTSERTIISFLMRPVLEHMNRAFRED